MVLAVWWVTPQRITRAALLLHRAKDPCRATPAELERLGSYVAGLAKALEAHQ